MLDLEKIANSGELFDGHYKLLDPLSTDGATTDIWLAVDMNTIEGDDKIIFSRWHLQQCKEVNICMLRRKS